MIGLINNTFLLSFKIRKEALNQKLKSFWYNFSNRPLAPLGLCAKGEGVMQ